jgi:acyl-CoA thioesterase I
MTERYVALGDSYTIGEGALPHEAWPNLLTTDLRAHGVGIELVANPSVTGWTSAQLIEHELPVMEAIQPTFVTILVGVNDWVQGVTDEDFRGNLTTILDRAQASLPNRGRVLLVTIPDFSVTPAGATYSRGRDIPAGITAFNGIIRDLADSRALPVVDISPLSRELTGPQFVAADELHPSAAAYVRWEQAIFPAALALLKR